MGEGGGGWFPNTLECKVPLPATASPLALVHLHCRDHVHNIVCAWQPRAGIRADHMLLIYGGNAISDISTPRAGACTEDGVAPFSLVDGSLVHVVRAQVRGSACPWAL